MKSSQQPPLNLLLPTCRPITLTPVGRAATNSSETDALRGDVANDITNLRREISSVRAAIAETQANLASLSATEAALEPEVARTAERAQREVASLRAEVAARSSESMAVAGDLAARINAVEGASAQSSSRLAASHDDLAARVERIQSDVANVAAAVAEQGREEVRQRQLDAAHRAAVEEASKYATGDDSRVRSVEAEVGALRTALASLRDDQTLAGEALAKDVHTISDATAALKQAFGSRVDTVYERLRVYITSVERQQAETTAAFRQDLERTQTAIRTGQTQQNKALVGVLEEVKHETVRMRTACEESLRTLAAANDRLSGEVKELATTLEETRSENADLRDLVRVLGSSLEGVRAETRRLPPQIDSLEKRLYQHRRDVQRVMDKQKREETRDINDLRSAFQSEFTGLEREVESSLFAH